MDDLWASAELPLSFSRSEDYIVVSRQKSVVAYVEARLKEGFKVRNGE